MAQAVRDIRRRIKAIRSTQQITRAMQMVAAAKLRKAQVRAVSARAYSAKLAELLGRLTSDEAHIGHALLGVRPARRVSILVVSADRGLAGSYNTNLFRRAEAALSEAERRLTRPAPASEAVELLTVGRKGRDYFRRRGRAVSREAIAVSDDDLGQLARDLAVRFIERFSRGETDEVILVYSRFISTMVQQPVGRRLLPVTVPEAVGQTGSPAAAGGEAALGGATAGGATTAGGAASADRAGDGTTAPTHRAAQDEDDDDEAERDEGDRDRDERGGDGSAEADRTETAWDGSARGIEIRGRVTARAEKAADLRYVYEPNARAVYSMLLPKFVTNQLFQALMEARASEYAARMTAMAAATGNANDLIGRLTLEMHHARQASITQEIMELVSGAEALKER